MALAYQKDAKKTGFLRPETYLVRSVSSQVSRLSSDPTHLRVTGECGATKGQRTREGMKTLGNSEADKNEEGKSSFPECMFALWKSHLQKWLAPSTLRPRQVRGEPALPDPLSLARAKP